MPSIESRQADGFKTWEQAARCTADALLVAIHTGEPSAHHPFIINYLSEEPTAQCCQSGSEGHLKWACVSKGKTLFHFNTNSLSTIFQLCTERVKGGQHLVRNGRHLTRSKPSILLLFQMSSNASCGHVVWVALSKLVLGNAAIGTALVTTGCGPVKTTLDPTPGDINYF